MRGYLQRMVIAHNGEDRWSEVGTSCGLLSANFKNYEQAATVTAVIDDVIVHVETFETETSFTIPFDPTVPHTYLVTVVIGQLTPRFGNTAVACPAANTLPDIAAADDFTTSTTATTAVVSPVLPTNSSALPATGADLGVGAVAGLFLAVGVVCAALSRRHASSTVNASR